MRLDALQPLLSPLGSLYCLATDFRNKLYECGVFEVKRVRVPVISIGNLAVGGTGKTPTVLHVAESLRSLGIRVAIVSRGYRRKSRSTVVVSDGEKLLEDVYQAGDEPYMLASRASGVPVVVDEVRHRGATAAIDRFRPDIVLLDDGFQHRSLHRDFDVVLIDATRGLTGSRCLPAGFLREHPRHLRRAHAIVITRVTTESDIARLTEQIKQWTAAPVYPARFVPLCLVDLHTGDTRPLSLLEGRSVLAFAGIGQPDDFHRMLTALNVGRVTFRKYFNHYFYDHSDMGEITSEARAASVDCIVTTEKDMVRIRDLSSLRRPAFALRIALRFTKGEPDWHAVTQTT